MDPFSKRLRKQHERSSLHARQLNKNAASLLYRQLHVLERRQQQKARALTRSRQVILQELTDSEEPEHERMDKPGSGLRTSSVVQKSVERRQSSLSLSSVTQHKLCAHSPDDPKFSHPQGSSSGLLNPDMPLFFPGHHHQHRHHHQHPHPHYDNVTDKNSEQVCRFRALSPLNPCPYFPCRRPVSYHHLKVSDIPDVGPMRLDPEMNPVKSPMTVLHADPTTARSPSDPGGKAGRTGTSCARGSRQKDGPISPRTSINERLRGLRELVRELREKNEVKRPRDWAVNYGKPVSRRLLRKPVVPVSDE